MRKETNKLHTLRLNNEDKLDLQKDQLNNKTICGNILMLKLIQTAKQN